MPTVWRLCDARWASSAFSGDGASLHPGRWNPAGHRMVYCAATRSLAALELLAHVEDRALLSRARFVAIPADIPEELIQIPRKLPTDWDALPPGDASRGFGQRFLDGARHPALRVPSATIPGEFNYVLNPAHPAFAKILVGRAEPFSFDPRLASANPPRP